MIAVGDDWIVDRIPVGPGLVKKHGRLDVNLFDPRRSDATLTVPVAHAYTHGVAGGDPVTIAQSQVTDLVSDLAGKVGTGDSRLSDARTPTAHAASHEDGGSDELLLAPSQIDGLTAYIDALIAAIIPPFDIDDAYSVLGVASGGASLVWVPAPDLFGAFYDFADDYDTSDTYD